MIMQAWFRVVEEASLTLPTDVGIEQWKFQIGDKLRSYDDKPKLQGITAACKRIVDLRLCDQADVTDDIVHAFDSLRTCIGNRTVCSLYSRIF